MKFDSKYRMPSGRTITAPGVKPDSKMIKELVTLAEQARWSAKGSPEVCTLHNMLRHAKRCGEIHVWMVGYNSDGRVNSVTFVTPAKKTFII